MWDSEKKNGVRVRGRGLEILERDRKSWTKRFLVSVSRLMVLLSRALVGVRRGCAWFRYVLIF